MDTQDSSKLLFYFRDKSILMRHFWGLAHYIEYALNPASRPIRTKGRRDYRSRRNRDLPAR